MSNLTPEQIEDYRRRWSTDQQQLENSKNRLRTREEAAEAILDLVPHAINAIQHIVRWGSSEALKFRASTWVLDFALAQENEKDPLESLMREFQAHTNTDRNNNKEHVPD